MPTAKKTPVKKPAETLSVDELFEAPIEETPEQKRIAELEALLAAAEERERTNPHRNGRPVPEAQLTPEQKRIRDLEDRLAHKNANFDPEPELVSTEDGIHFHVIKDGFNAFGQIWYRGQELLVNPNGEIAEGTRDRLGNSWLDLIDDPSGQMDQFGDHYLRRGPFKGRKGEVFNDEIAQLDKRRGLAIPVSRED